jgi:signal transduction histidine kinase
MTVEHLHFSTEMLRRLGEELNPHTDQGVLELVRNAYDADATECVVELINTQQAGGMVRVTDNGTGMTADSIRDGWLVLGKSEKVNVTRTGRKRIPIGNKGIGRLAALRLGRVAVLTTRPSEEPSREYRLSIDWTRFDRAKVVDEVPLTIESSARAPKTTSGTVVEVSNLRSRLSKPDVKRLARALILLADPFRDGDDASGGPADFRPVLRAQAFKELEQLVARGYRDEADYYLCAGLDKYGRAGAFVRSYDGEELFRASHQDISTEKGHPPYSAPAAAFELWWFLLSGANFSPRSVTLSEVREWLAEFGGVHLYHRGMRVSPYSDFDWLDMNLRRVRSPEHRPSTNNSIGRIAVIDESGQLQPKTDRMGFVEDVAFQDLRRFASDVLDWFADRMLKRREERRGSQKARAAKKVRRAQKMLKDVVESVPADAKEKVRKAIGEYERAKERETNTLREDLQLYRTLGTVGTTAAAFAHQSKNPLVHIASSAGTLEEAFVDAGPPKSQVFAGLAAGIRRNAESLLAFAKVTLGLLQHEKRRRGAVSLNASVNDIVSLLQPYIELSQASVLRDLKAEKDIVLASRAALESILTNLLINALKAFEKQPPRQRQIAIRTRNAREPGGKERPVVQLAVLDSGPGITGLSVEDIWLPGKTTPAEGTGLGLTIVRDVVVELGGRVAAVSRGELGGAEFLVQLPVRGGS